MEIRQLRYLVTIVEAGGFTRAAEREHVAQPGVSAQIRQLERSGRGVRLTDAGAAVLPHARAALRAIDDLRDAAEEMAGLVRGHVRLGMLTSCGVPDVPVLLERFRRVYPGIDITLEEASSHALVDKVTDGTLDLALIALTHKDPEGLELKVIADEAIMAVVAYGAPLSMPVGSGTLTVFDEVCTAAGVRPRIWLEAMNAHMLADFAGLGSCVAI